MHLRVFVSVLAGIGLAAAFAGNAVAGGLGPGCGYCGYGYPVGHVYHAPVVPHRVVRFSEFDYYSAYPLVGCYCQETPIRDWRGNWFWGTKTTCY